MTRTIRAAAALVAFLFASVVHGAAPARLPEPDQPPVRASYRLSDHSVHVYADLVAAGLADEGAPAGETMELTVALLDGKSRRLIVKTLPRVPVSRPFHLMFPTGELPEGVYTAVLAGNWRRAQASFRRVHEPWEVNAIGVTDKAIHPWTPVQVTGQTVGCWGREYRLGTLGLPAAVTSTQPEPSRGPATRDLLAAPVELVVEDADGLVVVGDGPVEVNARGEASAAVTASARVGPLAASLAGVIECDGFYQFTIRLEALQPADVQSIRLEVPLPDDVARLLHATSGDPRANKAFLDLAGQGDGVLWTSAAGVTVNAGRWRQKLVKAARPGTVGNLYPFVWVGDEDRGLALMADSDRGWITDPARPYTDLVRAAGQTRLRVHLVNRPVRLERGQVVEATLALQATPVRPRPAGGSWKAVKSYGWAHFGEPVIGADSFALYEKGQIPPTGPRFATDEERRRRRWWKYINLQAHRIPPHDRVYGPVVARYGDEWGAGLHVPSHRNFLLWAYQQWADKAGLKGLYCDNAHPALDARVGGGVAWEDEAGRLHPAYTLFGTRDFMKRARTLFLEHGEPPVMMADVTDAPVVGALGFADFWLDGEGGGYPDPGLDAKLPADFVDRWYNATGMANLRTTLGRQWGAMPRYLNTWGVDATYAVLGLFDLDNSYTRLDGLDYDFGLRDADCRFIGYWDVANPVEVVGGTADVLAAAWSRPGRLRVLVSNFGEQDRVVSIRVRPEGLSLPDNAIATAERTGAALRCEGGVVSGVTVARHNYAVVLLAPFGDFPAVHTKLADDLVPAVKLGHLCDDFNARELDPAWTLHSSPANRPKTEQDTDPVAWIENRALRLYSGPGAHALVSRRLGEDHCSVQVKLRAWGGETAEGSGPGLVVYWDKGRWVQLIAGGSGAGRDSFAVRAAGATEPPRRGPAYNTKVKSIAWLKVTLRPEAVEFHASVDGKAWSSVATLPRAGLEGPAAALMLGYGNGGENDLLRNDAPAPARSGIWGRSCYFDDLVVGRVQ